MSEEIAIALDVTVAVDQEDSHQQHQQKKKVHMFADEMPAAPHLNPAFARLKAEGGGGNGGPAGAGERRKSARLTDFDATKVQAALRKQDALHAGTVSTGSEVKSAVKAALEAIGAKSKRVINLASKQITNEDVQLLVDALMHDDKVEELDLSDNYIGDEAALCLSKLIASGSNTTLCSIFLDDDFITDQGSHALVQALKKNSTLIELTLNPVFASEDDIEAIEDMLDRNWEAMQDRLEGLQPSTLKEAEKSDASDESDEDEKEDICYPDSDADE